VHAAPSRLVSSSRSATVVSESSLLAASIVMNKHVD